MIDALNGWATKVSRKTARSKKSQLIPRRHVQPLPDTFQPFTVSSEADLDQLIKSHPQVAALPSDNIKIRKILKSIPVQLECGHGEVLCLVDSGSTVNAAHIARHFPAREDTVKSTR